MPPTHPTMLPDMPLPLATTDPIEYAHWIIIGLIASIALVCLCKILRGVMLEIRTLGLPAARADLLRGLVVGLGISIVVSILLAIGIALEPFGPGIGVRTVRIGAAASPLLLATLATAAAHALGWKLQAQSCVTLGALLVAFPLAIAAGLVFAQA